MSQSGYDEEKDQTRGVYQNGLPHPPASLRKRIALELFFLALATAAFLFFVPPEKKTTGLYVGMALIALGGIGFSAKETQERIWGPPASPEFDRLRRCAVNVTLFTLPPLIIFFVYAILAKIYGFPVVFSHDPQVAAHQVAANPRILNVHFLLMLCFYLPWAMLQQTLFQFYLLGRLRCLFPFASPLLLSIFNGTAYGLVHLPDPWVTLVTILGGIFWSYSYHRDRYVVPIAISHALLGSTFYFWVYGRDLWAERL